MLMCVFVFRILSNFLVHVCLSNGLILDQYWFIYLISTNKIGI